MSARDHSDAVLTLARSSGPTALTVLDGVVASTQTRPYVLAYFSDEDPIEADSTGLDMAANRFVLRGYFHCVGDNAAATRALADKLRGNILGVTPTVAGRACFPIRREESQPPQRDESTGTLVMDRVDVYRLESVPG